MERIACFIVFCVVVLGALPAMAESVTEGSFPVCSKEAFIDEAIHATELGDKRALKKLKAKGCRVWKAGIPIKRVKRLNNWFWGGACKATVRSKKVVGKWFVVWTACANIVDKE